MNSVIISRSIISVYSFIDWNTQIYRSKCLELPPEEKAFHTLEFVCRSIGKILNVHDIKSRFDVKLRLYHGWRKGFEESENKRALARIIPKMDFSIASCNPKVSIRSEISYGDKLHTALDCRIHMNIDAHLPDTYRKDLKRKDKFQEKMVDTAMAADIVNISHREHDAWILVYGRDDDIIPAIFTAESVSTISNRQIILVRESSGKFLKLDGLLYN